MGGLPGAIWGEDPGFRDITEEERTGKMTPEKKKEWVRKVFESLSEEEREEVCRAVDDAVIDFLRANGFAVYDEYGARMVIAYFGIDVSDIVIDAVKEKLVEMGKRIPSEEGE